jgi:hypothetical protein
MDLHDALNRIGCSKITFFFPTPELIWSQWVMWIPDKKCYLIEACEEKSGVMWDSVHKFHFLFPQPQEPFEIKIYSYNPRILSARVSPL